MKRGPAAAVLLCCALGLSWQWLTVHANYRGNWTALFCHGSQFPVPAALAFEHVYVFPNSGGYDGQSYHYIAHDPLDRTAIGRAVPDPSLRYPRILVPGLAHMLAFGRSEWIDVSLFAVTLLFLGLGAYWLAILFDRAGWPPLLAALYAIMPAALISLDRMLVDLALASLALGFAVYLERPRRLFLILLAAPLCRESGFLLFGAYAVYLLTQRRYARVALFATALMPAILWIVFVRTRVPGGATLGLGIFVPFQGMIDAVMRPRAYPFSASVVAVIRALDWVQRAGIVLAIAFAFERWRKIPESPVRLAAALFAIYAITLPPGVYDDPFSASRILAPLFLYEFLDRRWLPLALVAPRVYLELAPQVLGILKFGAWL